MVKVLELVWREGRKYQQGRERKGKGESNRKRGRERNKGEENQI